jgi:hypothetical protein
MTLRPQFACRRWLLAYLQRGPAAAATVYKQGARQRFSVDQIRRAKAAISGTGRWRIDVTRGGPRNGCWIWTLANDLAVE